MKRIVVFLIIALVVLSACEPLQTPPAEAETKIIVFDPTETLKPQPTTTSEDIAPAEEASPTESAAPRPTATALATNPPPPAPLGDIIIGEQVEVPEGSFIMGCDPQQNGGFNCLGSELPGRAVTLSAFLIDKYEVTNTQYRDCVADGGCREPRSTNSQTRTDYYTNPEYDLYPVVFVSYQDAQDFCEWAGMRLPTEAEWEKAASSEGHLAYPWGSEDPDCTLANSRNNLNATACVGDTTAVGSYPQGASAFGIMDMAGNVWEWVADYYDADYYSVSPAENPQGPESGSERVVRGGGWSGGWRYLRSASRAFDLPFYSGADLGFRCAADLPQD